MKVNWFIPVDHRDYNNMPASVWIRCLQLIPYIEELGVSCSVNDPDAYADVDVFVRWQDERARTLAIRQKRKGRKVVFDLCVNYLDVSEVPYAKGDVTEGQVQECMGMLDASDAVSCGSQFIADRAANFHGDVVYLPESVDLRHFRHIKDSGDFKRPRLRAIWSGTTLKAPEIEPILPVLKRHGFDLVVVSEWRPKLACGRWPWRRAYRFNHVRWTYEDVPREFLGGELAVSYRSAETPYNKGHSHFKIGVFMAQGVPAAASPLSSYREVLKDGGGRVCETLEDWELCLRAVSEDRGLLVKWSDQAMDAMEPYSTANVAKRYKELFERLRGGGRAPA